MSIIEEQKRVAIKWLSRMMILRKENLQEETLSKLNPREIGPGV
jgi:hypothetical protein